MPPKKKTSAFFKKLKVSPELQAIVGAKEMARTEVVKKLWIYIKKHKLQDPNNLRDIIPDEKLAKVFGSKRKVNMFKMTKIISGHLT
jgi:chromatin remodeling complex protein RSC6